MKIGGSGAVALPVLWLRRLRARPGFEPDHIILRWDIHEPLLTIEASVTPEPLPGEPGYVHEEGTESDEEEAPAGGSA